MTLPAAGPLALLLALLGAGPAPEGEALATWRASFAGEPATVEAAVERADRIRKAGDALLAQKGEAARAEVTRALVEVVASGGSEERTVGAHNVLARALHVKGYGPAVLAAIRAAAGDLERRVEEGPRERGRGCAVAVLRWLEKVPDRIPKAWPDPEALPKLVRHVEKGEWRAAHSVAENSLVLAIPDEETAQRLLTAFRQGRSPAADLLPCVRPAERLGRMLSRIAAMMSDAPDEASVASCERVLRRGAIESRALDPDRAYEAIGPALVEALDAGPGSPRGRSAALLLARIRSPSAVRAIMDAIRDGRANANLLGQTGHPEAVPDLVALLEEADDCAAQAVVRALGNCGAPGKEAVRRVLFEKPGLALVGLETFCPLVADVADLEAVERAAARFRDEQRRLFPRQRGETTMEQRMWRVIRGRLGAFAKRPEAARAVLGFLDRHPGAALEGALFEVLRTWPPDLVAPVLDDLAAARPDAKDLVRELRERVAEAE